MIMKRPSGRPRKLGCYRINQDATPFDMELARRGVPGA
jgi:hypothetical protein